MCLGVCRWAGPCTVRFKLNKFRDVWGGETETLYKGGGGGCIVGTSTPLWTE